MSDYPRLSYSQLADLLNYVVGLPHVGEHGRITRERISVCIVQTWTAKYERLKIEHVCEIRLVQLGVLPPVTRRSRAGRPIGELPKRVQSVIKSHGVML